MKQIVLISILLITMTNSCSIEANKKHVNVLEKALKEKYGVESVSILNNEEKTDIDLTVHLGKELIDVGDVRLIGSNAVLLLYNDLTEKEKKDIGSLKVAIETPTSKSDIMEYRTSDLKEIASLLKLDDHMFDLLKKRDYNSIKTLIWPQEILPQVDHVLTIYEAMCKHDGEITKIELLGFNFVEKTVARTGVKIPVFVAWFGVNHGTVKSEYQFNIRMDTRQVITFSINES